MGKYFRMSTRFDKRTPHDFGLTEVEETTLAVNPEDGTLWERRSLFDFGWGKENGYFRRPLLLYNELLAVVLSSEDRDDVYGAAAVILDQHTSELLDSCEMLFSDNQHIKEARVLGKVFDLQKGINLSPTIGKTWEQIQEDTYRWKAIAIAAKSNAIMANTKAKPFWRFR